MIVWNKKIVIAEGTVNGAILIKDSPGNYYIETTDGGIIYIHKIANLKWAWRVNGGMNEGFRPTMKEIAKMYIY